MLVIMRRNLLRQGTRARGFTLLELMIALFLLAILATLAAVNFGSITGALRVRAAALDLSSDLAYARSEAVKRNADVTLARIGGEWATGWAITASGGAVTLRTRNALPSGLSTSSTTGTFVFDNAGRVGGTGNVTLCPSAPGLQGRRISIDTVGLARSEKLSC
jgi:type IV fimbrial biogenesis protein FimT